MLPRHLREREQARGRGRRSRACTGFHLCPRQWRRVSRRSSPGVVGGERESLILALPWQPRGVVEGSHPSHLLGPRRRDPRRESRGSRRRHLAHLVHLLLLRRVAAFDLRWCHQSDVSNPPNPPHGRTAPIPSDLACRAYTKLNLSRTASNIDTDRFDEPDPIRSRRRRRRDNRRRSSRSCSSTGQGGLQRLFLPGVPRTAFRGRADDPGAGRGRARSGGGRRREGERGERSRRGSRVGSPQCVSGGLSFGRKLEFFLLTRACF